MKKTFVDVRRTRMSVTTFKCVSSRLPLFERALIAQIILTENREIFTVDARLQKLIALRKKHMIWKLKRYHRAVCLLQELDKWTMCH